MFLCQLSFSAFFPSFGLFLFITERCLHGKWGFIPLKKKAVVSENGCRSSFAGVPHLFSLAGCRADAFALPKPCPDRVVLRKLQPPWVLLLSLPAMNLLIVMVLLYCIYLFPLGTQTPVNFPFCWGIWSAGQLDHGPEPADL